MNKSTSQSTNLQSNSSILLLIKSNIPHMSQVSVQTGVIRSRESERNVPERNPVSSRDAGLSWIRSAPYCRPSAPSHVRCGTFSSSSNERTSRAAPYALKRVRVSRGLPRRNHLFGISVVRSLSVWNTCEQVSSTDCPYLSVCPPVYFSVTSVHLFVCSIVCLFVPVRISACWSHLWKKHV